MPKDRRLKEIIGKFAGEQFGYRVDLIKRIAENLRTSKDFILLLNYNKYSFK